MDAKPVLLIEPTEFSPSPLLYHGDSSVAGPLALVDESRYLSKPSLAARVLRRLRRQTGPTEPAGIGALNAAISASVRENRPRAVIVVKGGWVTAATIREIRKVAGCPIANYSTDNPFNPVVTTINMERCIGAFDYYFTPRLSTIDRLARMGQKEVHFVPFGFNPMVHFPAESNSGGKVTDVMFVGGADAVRVSQIEYLERALPDLRIRVYGGYWGRTSKRRLHGGVLDGRGYRLAVAGSRMCLNFGRTANEDGHTMKTFELPAMGACMLAEATEEHRMFLGGGAETGMFGSLDELVDQIRTLLSDEAKRESIRGLQHRILAIPENTYAYRLRQMLSIMGV